MSTKIVSTKKKTHYVNNKDFLESLIKYKERLQANPNVKIPDYLGICIMQICNKLSTKPNFSGYTFRDEMIADGIENCITAINGFNPEKSQNPFAYFTQIAWNAFIRRIQKEKKEIYIKHKNMQNLAIIQRVENISEDFDLGQPNNNDISNDVIKSYEERLTKSKKNDIVGLERFVEE
jgi:hypothetical protein